MSELLQSRANYWPPALDEQMEESAGSEARKVHSLQAFGEAFRPKTDLIYYPFCGGDPSPWYAFPDADVIGVDSDNLALQKLNNRGIHTAIYADIHDIDLPENPDVLIILGASGFIGGQNGLHLRPFTKPGGFIVTNSLPNTGYLTGFYKTEFELVGRIGLSREVEKDAGSVQKPTRLGHLQRMIKYGEGTNTVARLSAESKIMPREYHDDMYVLRRKLPSRQRKQGLIDIT